METAPPSQPTSLLDSLRSSTWHRHENFERLPFVTGLINGTLPLESYIAQLRGLAVIFSALEQTLAHSRTLLLERLKPLLRSRFELLCADLAFFTPRLVPDILSAVSSASDVARIIRSASCTCPDKLLGFLYVLEGTTKGNQVHLPDITRCFGLTENQGASFYRGYGSETDSHWHEFRSVMNSASEEVSDAALRGAVEMYDALERFHELLYPFSDDDRGFTAAALNPEAGEHNVPQNPAILQAALRAGRRCRDEFSYYGRRYGERGRRYTDSDAAWLAALAGQSAATVADQVQWLGRVLSSRGMPFLLMERQLELLVEELDGLAPTEALRHVLDGLRQQRCLLMPQSRFDETCRLLSLHFFSPAVVDFPDLPVILVAAQVDRLAGMPECMASLVAWLRSAAVLTEGQIACVGELLVTVRSGSTGT
jgi:heme oxygenase